MPDTKTKLQNFMSKFKKAKPRKGISFEEAEKSYRENPASHVKEIMDNNALKRDRSRDALVNSGSPFTNISAGKKTGVVEETPWYYSKKKKQKNKEKQETKKRLAEIEKNRATTTTEEDNSKKNKTKLKTRKVPQAKF